VIVNATLSLTLVTVAPLTLAVARLPSSFILMLVLEGCSAAGIDTAPVAFLVARVVVPVNKTSDSSVVEFASAESVMVRFPELEDAPVVYKEQFQS
jgi:hypothetical protein